MEQCARLPCVRLQPRIKLISTIYYILYTILNTKYNQQIHSDALQLSHPAEYIAVKLSQPLPATF